MTCIVEITVPIKTFGQISGHWTKPRSIRIKQQKSVRDALIPFIQKIKLPCTIHFQRIAPRELDSDNLITSFKSIRDTVCDMITPGLAPGRADGNKKFSFEYSQAKGVPKQYAVKIKISC